MVRSILYLLWFYVLGMGTLLHASTNVDVDASIDSANSQAHFPLQGTITITHGKEEVIDTQSFTLEGKPLDASLVKDVKMTASSDTLVSIYSFQLPAQDKGLYVLPSISVKIGNQVYHTTPSSYEVHEGTSSSATQSSSPTLFRLKAFVQGPATLYPGERTQLVYRISYNRSIDLTHSEFPMIHPAHFKKVGDVQVKDYQLKDVTIQDLTQEVEASELGKFSFGPSQIEGYAYTLEAGQKVYDPTLLKAEAPVITLEVKPFPQSTQPASFTGALGQIQAKASLTSSDAVSIGDILQLQVKVWGVSNLGELTLPLLSCQPGFSGFFQMSDLPPLAEVKGKEKFFYVELRPTTSLIHHIPAIEVSSFDTKTGKYVVQHTDPLSIQVQISTLESPKSSPIPPFIAFAPVGKWPVPSLSPLEMKDNHMKQYAMISSWLTSHRVLWMIPIGCLLLLLQIFLSKEWKKRSKTHIPTSETLFQKALKTDNLQLLEQAFWYRLWEKGEVPQGLMPLDKLSQKEKFSSVRAFLLQLQALQYSENKAFDSQQLKRNAKQLFEGLH